MTKNTERDKKDKKDQKTQYHHGDLRAALVQAAGEILTNEGPDALSLRGVAARAGVSHSAPYRHFTDRRALLSAVASEGFRELAHRQRSHSNDATMNLTEVGRSYLQFALEHSAMYRLMFMSDILEANPDPDIARMSREAFETLRQAINALLPDCHHTGALCIMMWSQLHGLAQMLLETRLRDWMRDGVDDDAMIEAACTTLPETIKHAASVLAAKATARQGLSG
ncbi:TetR/AcrR family transcriptional regulator [Shewanella cyperi]|uniref:TetR/AcrR family transcriptional regulator n=1 Tax=Shewanella cyperi TaxID=2814292 RepID=A0A974XN23_9GAMM|nr:TetR/AcrR family transcriptional regulator [Shewanella cyperi]QSX31445.1 TetR/AcrR family transcriptional regulator [Shewanella cyperi]